MGSGTWSPSTYASTTGGKLRSGTTFGYSTTMSSTPAYARVANDLLDPLKKRTGGAFAGQAVRESRESAEHPNPTPIIVGFDETGSMGGVPVQLQTELAGLFGLLLRKGYVEDPQIAISAYGDAYADTVPLQFGEFESDNRIDDTLDAIYVERNGGGNSGENANLIWYYAATHTATDAWDKRGKKGYLFTIGDEVPLGLTREQIKKLTGDDVEADLTAQQCADMVKERYEVFHVLIDNHTARWQNSRTVYGELLGADHIIELQDVSGVCAAIAGTIGLYEGTLDLDNFDTDLSDTGVADGGAKKALATVSARVSGAVAISDAPSDLDD